MSEITIYSTRSLDELVAEKRKIQSEIAIRKKKKWFEENSDKWREQVRDATRRYRARKKEKEKESDK
jgi:hypothetical protein